MVTKESRREISDEAAEAVRRALLNVIFGKPLCDQIKLLKKAGFNDNEVAKILVSFPKVRKSKKAK